jgi:capsid protein
MDITGRPGEKLQGFSPNVPNASFFEHAYLILTFIAINLNIPLMVLLLDPRQTNFSGWRGAMDMAKVGFQDVRSWMGTQFHTPVYRWWLQNEMAKDPALRSMAAKTGINVFGHQFKAPYDGYIEPFKDVQADRVLVESGLDSRRNVLARRGLDIEEVDAARVSDAALWIARCQEAAQSLSETLGVEVDWRTVSEAAAGAVDSGQLTVDSGEEKEG